MARQGCPQACFLYEDLGQVRGVCMAQRELCLLLQPGQCQVACSVNDPSSHCILVHADCRCGRGAFLALLASLFAAREHLVHESTQRKISRVSLLLCGWGCQLPAVCVIAGRVSAREQLPLFRLAQVLPCEFSACVGYIRAFWERPSRRGAGPE